MSFLRTGFHEFMRRLRRRRLGNQLRHERRSLAGLEEELGGEAWKFFAARPARAEPSLEPMLAPLRTLEADAAGPKRELAEAERALEAAQAARVASEKKLSAELASLATERMPLERELRALAPVLATATSPVPASLPAESTSALPAAEAAEAKAATEAPPASSASPAASLPPAANTPVAAGAPPATSASPAPSTSPVAIVPPADSPRARLVARLAEVDQKTTALREEQRRTGEEHAANVVAAQKKVALLQRTIAGFATARLEPLRALGRQVADDPDRAPEVPAVRNRLDLVRVRRERIARLEARRGALNEESRAADPQDLRLSVFAAATLAVIVGLALLIFFRAPEARDWLPADARALLSTNLTRLSAAGAAQPDSPWHALWTAATQPLAQLPEADPGRGISRVLLALGGGGVEYRVAETTGLSAGLIGRWEADKKFVPTEDPKPLALTLYRRVTGPAVPGVEAAPPSACAQIGPHTIAFGRPEQVKTLIRVRLGLEPDLRTDEDFYAKFERLERGAAFRLVTREPALLHAGMDPLLAPELVAGCATLGLAVEASSAGAAVPMTFLLRYQTEAATREAAARLRVNPTGMLRLGEPGTAPTALAGGVDIEARGTVVEAHFRLTVPAAREFLNRLASVHGPSGG